MPAIRLQTKELPAVKTGGVEDDSHLPDVPPLPRTGTGDYKAVKLNENGNGKQAVKNDTPEEH